MITKTGIVKTARLYENESGSTYTIVGTLTNNNGVFSGFAAGKYLKASCSVASNVPNIEIYGEYYASNITTEQYIIVTSTRNLAVKIQNSKFLLGTSSNGGSGWNLFPSGTTTLTVNKLYPFKVITDSTTVKLYVQIDGEWILQVTNTLPSGGTYTLNPDLCFGLHVPSNAVANPYPIDIKNFVVKKDGKVIWCGADAYLLNDKAKVGKIFISSKKLIEV